MPFMKKRLKQQYTIRMGTMEMVAPANMMFQAAVPSPAFLSMFTPTVRGRRASLVMVKTRGMMYSFQPPRKDSSATVASTGLSSGRMIRQ